MTLLAAPVAALPEPAEDDDPAGDPAAAASEQPCRRRLLLAVVAIAGVLAGAIGSAILVTVTFVSAAEDIGRGMSEGFGSVRESLVAPSDGAADGDVERFAAVAPGDLGEDADLDALARSCYVGDLAACDDLWTASPPMSEYEQYAATCAGRVKLDVVAACSDLG